MHSLVFFGSDTYSATALGHIIDNQVVAKIAKITIITDRPKPKDRSQVVEPNPVEKLAITHDLKVSYYPSNPDEMNTFIESLKTNSSFLDTDSKTIGLCASFDHLLPKDIIDLFDGNLYNLHPSLLPQYRNVSPVQYAIALGDRVTGITLFRIAPTIDDGVIIAQASEPILPSDTTSTLTPRLFALGAELFLSFLDNPTKTPAHHSEARQSEGWIFTRRLKRDSGYIEWGVLHKLLKNQPVSINESTNALLNLRLAREKTISSNLESSVYLLDLMRALNPWPTIWSLVPSKKGDLRITLVHTDPLSSPQTPRILLAGKPKPISYSDFAKYYLKI